MRLNRTGRLSSYRRETSTSKNLHRSPLMYRDRMPSLVEQQQRNAWKRDNGTGRKSGRRILSSLRWSNNIAARHLSLVGSKIEMQKTTVPKCPYRSMPSLGPSPRTLPRHCLRRWSPPPASGKRTLVSRLSPRHKPPVTELGPKSPYFMPQKWGGTTRLSMYYDNVIAPSYLLMSYDPTAKRPKQILPLRWDGTSPYHKNRPQPREPQPPPIRYPIRVKTIPQVESITVHSMMKSALLRKADVLNAAQALQSITGQRPTFVRSKSNVQAFKLRPGIPSIFARCSEGLTIRLAGRGKGSNSRSSNVGLSLYSSRDRSPSGPRL